MVRESKILGLMVVMRSCFEELLQANAVVLQHRKIVSDFERCSGGFSTIRKHSCDSMRNTQPAMARFRCGGSAGQISDGECVDDGVTGDQATAPWTCK